MIQKISEYTLGTFYIAFAFFNYQISHVMELGVQIASLVLALLGIVHLTFKIAGTRLDNIRKRRELDNTPTEQGG